jgi:hypothetical protein
MGVGQRQQQAEVGVGKVKLGKKEEVKGKKEKRRSKKV